MDLQKGLHIHSDAEYRKKVAEANLFFEGDGKNLNDILLDRYKGDKGVYGEMRDINESLSDRRPIIHQDYGSAKQRNRETNPYFKSIWINSLVRCMRKVMDKSLEPSVYHHFPKFSKSAFCEKVIRTVPESFRTPLANTFGMVPFNMKYYADWPRTRIPQKNQDVIVGNYASRNIAVFRKGIPYTMDVIDEHGRTASVGDIHRTLAAIEADADRATDEGEGEHWPVALLTLLPRDEWAEERERLMTDSYNTNSLKLIEEALFTVYLDSEYTDDHNARRVEMQYGNEDGNRWFDKCTFVSFDDNGHVTAGSECTTVNAVTTTDFAHRVIDCNSKVRLTTHELDQAALLPHRRISFNIVSQTQVAIERARGLLHHWKDISRPLSLQIEGIKRKSMLKRGLSPDAFVHTAIQVALLKTLKRTMQTNAPIITPGFSNSSLQLRPFPSFQLAQLSKKFISDGKISPAAFQNYSDTHKRGIMDVRRGKNLFLEHLSALQDLSSKLARPNNFFETDFFDLHVSNMASTVQNKYFDDILFMNGNTNANSYAFMYGNDFLNLLVLHFKGGPDAKEFAEEFEDAMRCLYRCCIT